MKAREIDSKASQGPAAGLSREDAETRSGANLVRDPDYQRGNVRLWNADCLDILPGLEGVDAVVTDPPYMGVVPDEWDNQWETEAEFLEFIKTVITEVRRMIADNGSLFLFASAKMVAPIEMIIREDFQILNQIVWSKPSRNRPI